MKSLNEIDEQMKWKHERKILDKILKNKYQLWYHESFWKVIWGKNG